MKHSVVRKQYISKMCFVCGEKNDFGLHASFYETGSGELVGLFSPSIQHQGYPGRLHGGIAATILDETMGRAIGVGKPEQVWSVTVEFTTKYRKPIPMDQEVRVVGRVTNEGTRIYEASGEIVLDSGEVAVTATGKYMKLNLEKITAEELEEGLWFYPERDDDPSEIEIP